MKKAISLISIILFLSTLVVACDKESSFDLGVLENGKYTNNYFGFAIEVDENYDFLTQEEILSIRQEAVDVNDEITTEELSLEEQPVVYYLYATKYENTEENMYNPYIAVYSENMNYLESSINTKEEYVQYNMDFAVSIFVAAGIPVSATNIDKQWYDDRQFANSVLSIEFDDVIMKKELFSIIKGEYAITVILGYEKTEDRQELVKFWIQ